jgi:hypothetical protein
VAFNSKVALFKEKEKLLGERETQLSALQIDLDQREENNNAKVERFSKISQEQEAKR